MIASVTLCSGFPAVHAACWLTGGGENLSAPIIHTISLRGAVSIGADLPINSIIYNGIGHGSTELIDSGLIPHVTCDRSAQFFALRSATPLRTQLINNTGVFGNLYESGIPGIGIILSSVTNWNQHEPLPGYTSTAAQLGRPYSLILRLIKIGPVTPSQITGASLPQLSFSLGQSGSMVEFLRLSFTGNMNITTPTCQTPDVAVHMGTWGVKDFSGIDTGTGWRDASIQMVNCGVFSGTKTDWLYRDGGNSNYVGNNTWTLTLTPLNGVIDSTRGIAGISKGDSSATGVGIQIGYGTLSTARTNLINFNSSITENISSTSGSMITIPLAARYIQTEDTITGGRADSKVTFTISYK